MSLRICAIDVGTHSTRSLTCDVWNDGQWESIDRGLKVSALGKHLSKEDRIPPGDAIGSAEAIQSFVQKARDIGADYITANGTMALRAATNASDIVALMEQKSGITINIISGDEEAGLIHAGVAKALKIADEEMTAIDVGGGSTEIVWNRGEEEPSTVSCETGCLTLTERFLHSDPPTPGEKGQMEQSIDRALANVLPPPCQIPALLAGAGGTITTAAAIALSMDTYDGNRLHGMPLSLNLIEYFYRKLSCMKLAEREKVRGLMKERAPVITAGLAIVTGIMRYLGSKTIIVSDYGILLGTIMKTFEKYH